MIPCSLASCFLCFSQAVLSKDTVEQLLQSQRAWEESEVGQRCGPRYGAGKLREQKDALVKGLVRRNVEGEQGENLQHYGLGWGGECFFCTSRPAHLHPATSPLHRPRSQLL